MTRGTTAHSTSGGGRDENRGLHETAHQRAAEHIPMGEGSYRTRRQGYEPEFMREDVDFTTPLDQLFYR